MLFYKKEVPLNCKKCLQFFVFLSSFCLPLNTHAVSRRDCMHFVACTCSVHQPSTQSEIARTKTLINLNKNFRSRCLDLLREEERIQREGYGGPGGQIRGSILLLRSIVTKYEKEIEKLEKKLASLTDNRNVSKRHT